MFVDPHKWFQRSEQRKVFFIEIFVWKMTLFLKKKYLQIKIPQSGDLKVFANTAWSEFYGFWTVTYNKAEIATKVVATFENGKQFSI